MVELRIKENEAGQRLDKYLHKYLKEAGNGFLYKMLRKKNITLNGKKAEGSERLCVGDEIKLFLSDETIENFGGRLPGRKAMEGQKGESGQHIRNMGKSPDNKSTGQHRKSRVMETETGQFGQQSLGTGRRAEGETETAQYERAYRQFGELEVVFENHHVLIVNKPSGILAQKAGAGDVSLNEWLTGYLLENGELTEEELHTFHPSVCNRLDRNTSGMVICGKTLLGSQTVSGLLRDRRLRKFYRLYVKGKLEDAFSVEGYLVKDGQANRVRLVEQAKGAAYIRTNFRPLRHYSEMTLVEAELITGKTHQIRLHLAGAGYPVLGDYKYGEKNFNDKYKKKYGVESQLLHACRLEFPVMEGPFSGLSEAVLSAREPELFGKIAEGEKASTPS